MIRGLWAFLRGLFRRPTPSAPVVAPADAPEAPAAGAEASPAPEPLAPQPVESPALEAAPAPQTSEDEADQDVGPAPQTDDEADEDEDWWGEDEDDVGDDEPDPFITGTTPADDFTPVDVEALRAQARTEALGGEHRVYLSNPAGPGSLAEALNQLLAEGRVEARFIDEADEGPHILYRPVS